MVMERERLCAGAQELRARRVRLASSIEDGDIALVASAAFPRRSVRFRQTNEFFYLTGLEVPGAYVLIDGAEGATTAYLPHRDDQRERTDGPALWAEDVDRVKEVAGVDVV